MFNQRKHKNHCERVNGHRACKECQCIANRELGQENRHKLTTDEELLEAEDRLRK